MKRLKVLVTVIDAATETSMPFNEFFLYREKHRLEEIGILISCRATSETVIVKSGLDIKIYETGMNPLKLRSVLQAIKREHEVRGEHCVFHLHSPCAAFLSLLALVGTGMWKRSLFTVHSTFSGYKLHNKVLSFLCALMAERVTCVSKAALDGYPSLVKKLKGDNIQAIPNGVDLERIDEAIEGRRKPYNQIVCLAYVARMIPIKNHEFLLEVLQKMQSKVHFLFIGADDSEQTIRHKTKKMGLQDCIEFTGLISRKEVFRRLLDADVYVSPSTLEGLPISVLEAMYCGLPAILSDIPPHKEVAKGADFISVLPLREEEWIQEIEHYVNMGETARKYLGEKCKKYVRGYFSLERMHQKYDRIYDDLWERR